MTDAHWLLPIDPSSHREHQPADWRTRPDATAVWEAIGRSQPIGRWCLRTGFRTMTAGDVVWAYLSKRQEVCAVGRVRAVVSEHTGPDDAAGAHGARWFVDVDWDGEATRLLCANPLSRKVFRQVPMSTCRARPAARQALQEHLGALREA